MKKQEKLAIDAKRDEYKKSIEGEYKEKEAAYYELKNRLALYEIAKKNGKLAKRAREAIAIREELGTNPEIVKLEKGIVDLSEKHSSDNGEAIRLFLKWLFVIANCIIVTHMSKEAIETYAPYCAHFALIMLFHHYMGSGMYERYSDYKDIDSMIEGIKKRNNLDEETPQEEIVEESKVKVNGGLIK